MSDDTFTFTVTNNTEQAITEVWASEDDNNWFQFGLSDEGIPAGKTVTLAWAEFTNDSPCEWYVQFVFEDESESEAALFNFCEEPDLVIS